MPALNSESFILLNLGALELVMNFGSVVDIMALAISSEAMLGVRESKGISTLCRCLRELLMRKQC